MVNYKKVDGIISKDLCEVLAGSILILEHNTPEENMGDNITPGAFQRHGYSGTDSLLFYVRNKLEEIVGRKLLPTFSYCRVYRNGHRLPQHLDRPSCELVISINLKNDGVPWPIVLGATSPVDVHLDQGDGVIYEGTKVLHTRKPFDGNEHVQVFLCYVYADGEHAHLKYDKRVDTFDPF